MAAKQPRPGNAPPGRSIDPRKLPATHDRPEPAPTHGTPLTPAEYDRLKDDAERKRPPPAGPSQEDSAAD